MMQFSVSEKDGAAIVILEGEMVGGPDATLLSEQLHKLLQADKKKIILDMAQIHYMNSSGLGILIGGLTTVRNHGGDIKLLHLAPKLKELLRITKLDCVFDVFENEEEAIGSFA